MNRNNNILNGSLLGTSGRSSKVFLKAVQWSSMQSTVLLHAGRNLVGSTNGVQQTLSVYLRAGRKLKSTVSTSLSVVSTIRNITAIALSAVATLSVQGTSFIKRLKAVSLVSSNALSMGVSASIQKVTLRSLAASFTGIVSSPLVTLVRGIRLRCVTNTSVSLINAKLSESSRSRAPLKRTAFVLGTTRMSVISKE